MVTANMVKDLTEQERQSLAREKRERQFDQESLTNREVVRAFDAIERAKRRAKKEGYKFNSRQLLSRVGRGNSTCHLPNESIAPVVTVKAHTRSEAILKILLCPPSSFLRSGNDQGFREEIECISELLEEAEHILECERNGGVGDDDRIYEIEAEIDSILSKWSLGRV